MKAKAMVYLVITALLWSSGGLLIKIVTWNPLAIAGTRSAISALVIFAFCRKMSFNWGFAQIGGALCYAGTVIFFVTATKLTTAANAILLQYTAPIYVALLSYWLLKERITRSDFLTIIATFGGMILFFLDDLSKGGFWGNVMAILSGIAFAGTALLLRKQKDHSPLESVFLGNILTFLIGLPFMVRSLPDAKSWIGLVLLGVFQLGISYILYAEAIKYVSALEAILIPILEPVLNPVWVFLMIGESPGPWAVIGGVFVLVSVTLRCISALKQGQSGDVSIPGPIL
jgi:drug/metabolite transporter (DMT)-like permease